MTSSGGSTSPFQVTYPGSVRAALADLQRKALQVGMAAPLLAAIQHIDDSLRQDPLAFGDPNYRLNVFDVRVAVSPPLIVHFGMDWQNRHVLVSGVKALPGSGL